MQSRLDIERLHHCVEAIQTHKVLGRGEGTTTARLMMLIGDIELGDFGNVYILVVDNQNMIELVRRTLCELLEEYGHELTYVTKNYITIGGAMQVRFVSVEQFITSNSLRGLRIARIFFDVSPHTLTRYNSEAINYSMAIARACGADVV